MYVSSPDALHAVWTRRTYALLLALLCVRLLYLAFGPLDLAPDEAYYWDWSRQLDYNYYSKPPMVAWVMALSTRLLGSTTFTVRLPAALLTTGGLWGLFVLARRMFDARAGFWAVAIAAATPGNTALSLLMTIDAPLVFFWTLSLYALWRALEARGPAWGWWLLAAVCMVLGNLSKFMMPIQIALFVVLCLFDERGRRALRTPGPYVWAACGALSFVPSLVWNMSHGWATYGHMTVHFEDGRGGSAISLDTFFESLAYQLALASPLTYVLFWIAVVGCLLTWRRLSPAVRFALVFSAIPLAVFVVFGLYRRVNANWPATCYPAAFVLLGAWLSGGVTLPGGWDRARRLRVPSVALGAVMVVLIYLLPVAGPAVGVELKRIDPIAECMGWREMGREVGAVWSRDPDTFLCSVSRQVTAELAFYVPGQPRTYLFPESGGAVLSQYEIWRGPVDRMGDDALIVIDAKDELLPQLVMSFDRVEEAGRFETPMRDFRMYWGRGLNKWPRDLDPPAVYADGPIPTAVPLRASDEP